MYNNAIEFNLKKTKHNSNNNKTQNKQTNKN